MLNRTTIKITLVLGGIALFGAGIRWDDTRLRWAGFGCVAIAWVLRFWKQK
jgi:hypothetical protein